MTTSASTEPNDVESVNTTHRHEVEAILERLEGSPYERHRELAATMRRIRSRTDRGRSRTEARGVCADGGEGAGRP